MYYDVLMRTYCINNTMEDPSYITYDRLIERVNLYRQGIMPNSTIQTWYNSQRRQPVCVKLRNDDTLINPVDVTNHRLRRTCDVNALTHRRKYLIVFFDDTDFEEIYFYEGISPTHHITTAGCDSDSDSD